MIFWASSRPIDQNMVSSTLKSDPLLLDWLLNDLMIQLNSPVNVTTPSPAHIFNIVDISVRVYIHNTSLVFRTDILDTIPL